MSLVHLDGSGTIVPVPTPQLRDAIRVDHSLTAITVLAALIVGLLLAGGKRKG